MKFLQSTFVILSAAAYCIGSNVADVQADINHLTSNITAFTNALSQFDAANFLASGIPLVTSAEGVIQALTDATTDAKALNHPVTNTAGLINAVNSLSTTIPNVLKAIGSAKSNFAAIPMAGNIAVGGVGGILVSLQSLSQTFANAAVAALPAAQQSSLTNVQKTVDTAFASAIATYGTDICASG